MDKSFEVQINWSLVKILSSNYRNILINHKYNIFIITITIVYNHSIGVYHFHKLKHQFMLLYITDLEALSSSPQEIKSPRYCIYIQCPSSYEATICTLHFAFMARSILHSSFTDKESFAKIYNLVIERTENDTW